MHIKIQNSVITDSLLARRLYEDGFRLTAGMTVFLLVLFFTLSANAFQAEEKLADAAQEQKAGELFKEFRCLVCQGESLAESNAGMSRDMRAIIREQVRNGKSEQEIREYLTGRYGENILQEPVVAPETYILWFAPLILLALGVIVVFRNVKSN